MLSHYPLITLISLFTITSFYLFIFFFQDKSLFKSTLKRHFSQLKFLIFIFHLLTAFALGGEVSDVKLFSSAGYCLWHKIDIYWLDASHGTYPFLPFTIYPYALFWFISSKFPFLTFSFLVKLLLLPILFLTASLIAKTLQRNGLSKTNTSFAFKNRPSKVSSRAEPRDLWKSVLPSKRSLHSSRLNRHSVGMTDNAELATKTNLVQLLLLTNPILFLAITFHGQADIALIYFFILSVFCLGSSQIVKMVGDAWRAKSPVGATPLYGGGPRQRATKESTGWGRKRDRTRHFYHLILSGILMAFSIMTKTWSVMFLPLIFFHLKSWQRKIIYFSSLSLAIFPFVLFYRNFVRSSLKLVLSTFFSHPAGAPGYWGITALLSLLSPFIQTKTLADFFSQQRFLIFFISLSLGLLFYLKKQLNLFQGTQLFILIIYVVTAGWGLQYSAWLIPFAILNKNWKKNHIYTLVTLPYLGLSYLVGAANWQGIFWHNSVILLSLFPWFYSLLWLFSFYPKKRK